jgi:beta-glucanase (GH16 family)
MNFHIFKEMRFLLNIFFLLAVVTNLHAQLPSDLSNDYRVVWQDEFNGTELDTSKWFYRAENTLREFGTPIRENVVLDGKGHLLLKATKKDSTYYCSQIATKLDQLFRYGYFECRVKVNQWYGPSTAFWIQSPTYGKIAGDPEKSGTEIDVLEYRRKYHTNRIYHTIHWIDKKGEHTQNGTHTEFEDVANGFHTYGVEWTPDYYAMYIDGERQWKTRQSISQIAQYIILSVELTGWSGDHTLGIYPDQAVFDYVRVWQKE